jgi:hypothetical protein
VTTEERTKKYGRSNVLTWIPEKREYMEEDEEKDDQEDEKEEVFEMDEEIMISEQ